MSAEFVEKKVRVPKELQDCLDCLAIIVKRVKAGDDISTIVASVIPPFLKAVEGAQNIPKELAEDLKAAVDAGVLFGSEVAFTFLPFEIKEVVQPKAAVLPKAKVRKGIQANEWAKK